VALREAQPAFRHAVEHRRALRPAAVAAQVGVAEVVGEDENEIRPRLARLLHSPATPVSRMTRPQAACPSLICTANSAGELPIGKMRAARSAAAAFSSFSAFTVSAW